MGFFKNINVDFSPVFKEFMAACTKHNITRGSEVRCSLANLFYNQGLITTKEMQMIVSEYGPNFGTGIIMHTYEYYNRFREERDTPNDDFFNEALKEIIKEHFHDEEGITDSGDNYRHNIFIQARDVLRDMPTLRLVRYGERVIYIVNLDEIRLPL